MKSYYSLGLMSGTSADGVDASVIQSKGDTEYKVILEKYFKYSQNIYENIHDFKEKINNSKDLGNFSKTIQSIEKEITLFHVDVVNQIIKDDFNNIWIVNPYCESKGNIIAVQSSLDGSWSHINKPDNMSYRPQTVAVRSIGNRQRIWIGFAYDMTSENTIYSEGGLKVLNKSK